MQYGSSASPSRRASADNTTMAHTRATTTLYRAMNPDELMAGAILAELLGARAEVNDGPGRGESRFDWRLKARDRTYAVEVTSHSDEAHRRFDAASEAQGDLRAFPDLVGLYTVNAEPTASVADLWRRVHPLIRDHFPEGVDYQALARMRWDPNEPKRVYAEMLTDVGVRWITASGVDGTSGIRIIATEGGRQDSSVVVDGALAELEPNRAKLTAASEVDERHLFVWIHPSAIAAHFALHYEGLPSGMVDLGPGIDVLWVAGADTSRRPSVISHLWRVQSNHPWEDWTPQVRAR